MKGFHGSRAWVILILLCLASEGPLWSQIHRRWIDPASQYRLYLKILTFDRNLRARIGDELDIGVLYAGLVEESRQARDDFARAVAAGPADFEGLPIRLVPIQYGKKAEIEASLAAGSVDALYVTPIGSYDLAPVSAACRARGVSTFSGIPEYLESGLSVSFGISGRQAKVLVNLANSRAEGSDFSARLLDMVTVVGRTSRGETP
jgi:hypothetical protein